MDKFIGGCFLVDATVDKFIGGCFLVDATVDKFIGGCFLVDATTERGTAERGTELQYRQHGYHRREVGHYHPD